MADLNNQPMLSFPALRGRMGSRDYYVFLLPLNQVGRILQVPDGEQLNAEARSQRRLNEKRIPEIARYILSNEEDWLFSSLTASFDGDENFISSIENPESGVLQLPLNSTLSVNDGQHRRAAIERALRTDPSIGKQTISVVLFPAENLERNQQMFSDLNRTVQKTSRSLNIMYDHRDPLNELTLALEPRVPILRGKVEKDSQSLAVRSAKLITLSALYDMCAQALGRVPVKDESEVALAQYESDLVDLWLKLTDWIPQWSLIAANDLRPAEARAEFIHAHAVFFFAIGTVAYQTRRADGNLERLRQLADVDWRRANPEWQGVCMLGPDIVTRRQTRLVLSEFLMWKLGLRQEPPSPAFN